MSTVVKIENLSKRYVIRHKNNDRYLSLRDVITSQVGSTARRMLDRLNGKQIHPANFTQEEFWALKDINLEIKQGDRVGIIGRNGAGKSTLLKVLSRITEPTRGKISIRGRVASLLEVGTGFHSELSGKENIFLNGAILGMSRQEIKMKFDEIVSFAGVEKFLDTPVKRYSSGMYVRLAFSVAAHLEPDILIVDEVLAVGDAQFQNKCLGKMEEVGRQGRTVLFVSHNLASIQKLCSTGILLNDGQAIHSGPIDNVIRTYIDETIPFESVDVGNIQRARPDLGTRARFVQAYGLNSSGERTAQFLLGEEVGFELVINTSEDLESLSVVAGIDSCMDYRITTVMSEDTGNLFSMNGSSTATVQLRLPGLRLKPGTYFLALGLRRNRSAIDHVIKALKFEISEFSQNQQKQKNRETSIDGDVLSESIWSLKNEVCVG